MPPHGVISADSHVTEPATLWEERLEPGLRDRAPHVVRNEGEGPAWLFVAEGARPFPVSGGFAAGRSGEELAAFQDKGYEAARPSGWDPAARLEDQALDGIDAEVLYPTLGMKLFAMENGDGGELQRACFRAYNAWLAEYCAHAPQRLVGIGLVSLEDLDLAGEAAVADGRLVGSDVLEAVVAGGAVGLVGEGVVRCGAAAVNALAEIVRLFG